MKNKKGLISAISWMILFIVLTIIGNLFCAWSLYLMPIAFAPIIGLAIKNWKNLFKSFKSKKNIVK